MPKTAVPASGTIADLLTVLRTYRKAIEDQRAIIERLMRPEPITGDAGNRRRERAKLWRLYYEMRRYYDQVEDVLEQERWAETDEVMLELRALGSAVYRARDTALEAGWMV